MISLSLKCKSNLFSKQLHLFLSYHINHRHVLGDNELMIHSPPFVLLNNQLLEVFDWMIRRYDYNMKSSNSFVWKDVEEIDDGHIHASTAVVAVEMNTTSVLICLLKKLIFFFSKNLNQSDRFDVLDNIDGLSRRVEKWKEWEGERESIYDEHVHDDGNQLLLSFSSSSSSSSVCTGREKERTTFVNGEPVRPSSTTATRLLHCWWNTTDGKEEEMEMTFFSLLPSFVFSLSSPSSCQMSAPVDEGSSALMGCYMANGRGESARA